MNYKALEARHLTQKRQAERERDEARAQRDKLADLIHWSLNYHMEDKVYDRFREALTGLDDE